MVVAVVHGRLLKPPPRRATPVHSRPAATSCLPWFFCELTKCASNLADGFGPLPSNALPEQTHGLRIPDAVVAQVHPAPVCTEAGYKYPTPDPQRASQMGDGCVDADEQIE